MRGGAAGLVLLAAAVGAGITAWFHLVSPVVPGRGPDAPAARIQPAPVARRPPPPPEGPVEVHVDLNKLSLTLHAGGRPYYKYPIAIGRWHTPTPVGEFIITEKYVNPGGPFGSRWMGLNVPWGSYGIHGTNHPGSIGWAASAGCIRMFNRDVAELFEWVPVGTRVIITGYVREANITMTLRPGYTGQQVQYFQYRLRQAGFDPGPLDGWFGPKMEAAVRELQWFYGLPVTGQAGTNELYVLGLR